MKSIKTKQFKSHHKAHFTEPVIALHPFAETSLIFFHFQLSECEHPEKILHQIFDLPFLWLPIQHLYTFIWSILKFCYTNHVLLPPPNEYKDARKERKDTFPQYSQAPAISSRQDYLVEALDAQEKGRICSNLWGRREEQRVD